MKNFLPILPLIMAMASCASNSGLGEHERSLLWIEGADPQKDAEEALARNDFRLLGMTPRTLVIPGVPQEQTHNYELKCGVRKIEGVTDVVRSQEHLRLMKEAHKYALKYNALIKQHCQP